MQTIDSLTDEQILAQLEAEKAERARLVREARENLEKYGSTLPPIGALAVSTPTNPGKVRRIAPRQPKAIDPKWFGVEKKCPRCEKVKNVGREFGIVTRRGVESAAGWCKQCRSETGNEYRKAPRKNRSKHNPKPSS